VDLESVESIYPLTPLQQGLLFHSLLTPHNGVYVVQVSCRLRGPLNLRAFEHAWLKIIERHAVFRTFFIWENIEKPVQVVQRQASLKTDHLNWRFMSNDAQQTQLIRYLKADRARGFELSKAPLMRIALVELEADVFQFIWSHHHLLLDGWCLSPVLREVFAFYEADCQGKELQLAPRPPYANYVAWLQRQDLTAAEMFWRLTLKGFTAPTPIGADHVAKHQASTEESYGNRTLELSAATTLALQALARRQKLTLSTIVQGAWAILLSRYSREKDVVFGTTVSGRPASLPGVEQMVGLFINTLPVRARVDPRAKVVSWLKDFQREQAEAREYEHSPLIEVQRWSEVRRGEPLFESTITFENYPRRTFTGDNARSDGSVRASALEVRYIHSYDRPHYPLSVTVVPEASLLIMMIYERQRFDGQTIERMLVHFERLLEGMVGGAEQRISELRLLSLGEDEYLRVGLNQTGVEYEWRCVHEMFEEQAGRTPGAVAVVTEEEQVSYEELNRRAERVARRLREMGVGAETVVGLMLPRSVAVVVGLLGILKAGGAYLPLDAEYPPRRLQWMIEDAQVGVLITQAEMMAGVGVEVAQVLYLEREQEVEREAERPESETSAREGREAEAVLGPDNLAYVIYTSGSTGTPKGTLITHRAINRLVFNTNYIEVASSDRLAQVSNISFDAATFEIWGALLHGAQLNIITKDIALSPLDFASQINLQGITIMFLTTPLFNQIAREVPWGFHSLRCLLVGGEFADPKWFREVLKSGPPKQLLHVYGPTENTTFSTWYWVRDIPAGATSIPIGRPITNSEVYVLDEEMEVVGPGVVGMLYVGGAGLARGYRERAELTAESFMPHRYSREGGERMYRTGDLVRWRVDGVLEFIGRRDEQVKVRGFRVEVGEIEAALRQHPEIAECVVVAREDAPGEKRLVAYVVKEEGSGAEWLVSEWREYLGQQLPEYMIPAAFVSLESLPLTPNGKVDRQALPAPEMSRQGLSAGYRAAGTETEERLAEIWAQVLRVERVGVEDNFFELGGDSILSVQIIARANEAGLRLTARQIFQYQTVAELAAVAGTAEGVAAPQGRVRGTVALTPIQEWFFEQQVVQPEHFNMSVMLRVTRQLEAGRLRQAVAYLLEHHDALRLRFKEEPEGWRQWQGEEEEAEEVPSHLVDLSGVGDEELRERIEQEADGWQRSLELSRGPVLRLVYMDCGPERAGRVLVIAHHLVMDLVSWQIVLEDLERLLEQLEDGAEVRLRAKTSSYQQWAERLVEYAGSERLRGEEEYWLEVGRDSSRVGAVPVEHPGGGNLEGQTQYVTVRLSEARTRQLQREVPKVYNTQTGEVLLAGLVQAYGDWSGEGRLLVDVEGHGREALFAEVELTRTVGWFTSIYPVVLEREGGGEPGAVLKSVKERMRRVPEGGVGYGVLKYLRPAAEVRRELSEQRRAEVSFNYVGRHQESGRGGQDQAGWFGVAEEWRGAARDERAERRYRLEVNAGVIGGELRIVLGYSAGEQSQARMEQLKDHYHARLEELIEHCLTTHPGAFTPSDFAEVGFTQKELDDLIAELSESDGGGQKGNIESIYPLSPLQQGLLFHTLYDHSSAMYLGQLSCVIRGDLNVSAFKHAWQRMLERHSVLRTLFVWDQNHKPLQVVRHRVNLPWEELDWRGLTAAEQAEKFKTYLKADNEQGFDFSKAPLMRLVLVKENESTYRFIWSHHHLLLDGWSVAVLIREVFAFYEAFCQGGDLELRQSLSYRTYIAWLQEQDLTAAELFWRHTLKGFTLPTLLGIGRTVPELFNGEERSSVQRLRLSDETTRSLESLAQQHQLTMNTIVQGAWAILLSRYSGREDVLFGATVSGRPAERMGVESMVGLFINTLPVRVHVTGEAPMLSWLRRLQDQQAEARQYEYSPLVEVQGWSKLPRGLPLFESIFVFENYPFHVSFGEHSNRLEIRDINFDIQVHYPLAVVIKPEAELLLEMIYDRRRFDDDMITRMLHHLEILLGAMAAQPYTQVRLLDMLSREDHFLLDKSSAIEELDQGFHF